MKRLWMVLVSSALVFGSVACSDETREDAGDVAGDVADEAEDVAKDAADTAEDAADKAEDVVDDETVNIDNNAYEPSELTIGRAVEVTWVNQDDVEHTVTSKTDAFKSERLGEGEEFSERFGEDGTFEYYCEVHGEDVMSGKVIVTNS